MKSAYESQLAFLASLPEDELLQHGDIPDLLVEIGHADYTLKELRRLLIVKSGTESGAPAFYSQVDVLLNRGFLGCDDKKQLFLLPKGKNAMIWQNTFVESVTTEYGNDVNCFCNPPGGSGGSRRSLSLYEEQLAFLASLPEDELLQHGDIPDLLVEIGHADYTLKELRRLLIVKSGTESGASAFHSQVDILLNRGFLDCDEKGQLFLPIKGENAIKSSEDSTRMEPVAW